MAKTIILNLCICLLYIIAGKFGLSLAFGHPSATAIWPPTGIALAAMLIFGFRVSPAIFLGAFIANMLTAGTPITSVGIACGNTLEAIAGMYFIKKFAKGIHTFESVADIFKFTFFAAFLATTLSANIGVLTLLLGGLANWHEFSSVWFTWWLGDMGGSLLITPLILVWWTHPRIPFNPKQFLHYLTSLVIIFLTTGIVFSGVVPYPYLYIPIAVWIAFWFGRRGATIATIIVATLSISYTISGIGPFALPSKNESLLQLQLFLNVFSLTSLIFAATVLEIRRNEKTLASHEQRFQALIEKSYDAFVLIDATSKILYASPSIKHVMGYEPKELVGTIGFNLVDVADRKRTMQLLAKLVLKPKSVVTTQYRAICKDKTIIWVEATGTNLLFEPDVGAVVVNFHDITESKLSEKKLLEEKLEDEAMLGSIGDGIIATDKSGKITLINQAALDYLGWNKKDIIGKSIVEVIPMEDENGKSLPVKERPMTKMFTLGKRVIISPKYKYVRKDGTKFPVFLTVTPIILDDIVVGAIEVFRDITREKEVDKAKSEFVSIASHQLRTPLATINWYLEELMRTGVNLNDKQKSYMQEVYSASKRMVALINALLNVSRVELGTVMVDPKKVNLGELVEQVLRDQMAQLNNKHITLRKNYQTQLPPIIADPKLLTIVLQNLIANAIKYSKDKGVIEIKILFSEKEFLISITDNGYGIPKNQQQKIFSKLFRADNARMVEPEGTGLGLYIVKEIVTRTGGKIWYVSEENKGTIFSVAFPKTGMQPQTGQNLIH